MIRKIMPQLAAELMGKNPQFIRIGLQRNLLPFGKAIALSDNGRKKRYSYYISPKLFMDYTGLTEKEILEVAKAKGYAI